MTVTVTPTPADGATIGPTDVLSYHLVEDNPGFAGPFTTIRIDLTINGVDQGIIYNATGGGFAAGYTGSDTALGVDVGDVSFSSIAGYSNGDTLNVVVTAFADFDGGNFPFSYTVGSSGPTVFLATVPRSNRSRNQ